ncbi:MAG: RsbRD N-terminal domain-containing protein [Deltaproteobacteria bacterium]|nr:RsbRD N-terminal domain-containing protein [Deltaproteobacteria bacterium]
MDLINFLKENKENILKKWFKHISETYHNDTSHFLINKKDPFANPVGGAIIKGLSAILDVICGEADKKDISPFIDPVIRIRAIQNFSPSESTAFILFLKDVVRERFYKESSKENFIDRLLEIETRIDEIVFIAFDIYAECREKINDIKANELKDRTYKAFERAGLVDKTDKVLQKP